VFDFDFFYEKTQVIFEITEKKYFFKISKFFRKKI